MAKIYDNGALRDMTAEEEAEIDAKLSLAATQYTDPTDVLETALNELGVTTRE